MMLDSLGLSLPLWLAGAAIIAGTAALYFLNERRLSARTLEVPFLKFCEAMPKGGGRKRPRWPLLFLLQLCALALLVAAASGLHRRSAAMGDGVVIIMDTSLSMQARVGGVTRFEQARREAVQVVDRTSASDLLLLIAAGDPPRWLSSNRPGEDPRAALQNLTVTDGRANLEAALDLAKNLLRAHAGRIHIFTDRGRDIYDAWDKKCYGDHPPVTIHRVGESAGNLAITGFSVYQSPLAASYQEVRVYLTLHNYFAQAVKAPYSITLDGHPIASGTCDLGPQEQRTLTFDGFTRPGRLRAAIDFEDALRADNEAFGLIVPIRPLRVLVVGETARLQEQLERTFAVRAAEGPFARRFDFKTPADVLASDAKSLDRSYDLVIFDGAWPGLASFKPVAALWNGAALATGAARNDFYTITDWKAQHELMEYLENFNLLILRAGARAPVAPEIEPIIEGRLIGGSAVLSQAVPVVGAGSDGVRRAVYFGFDIKDYRLQKYQHLKILLLNTLRWLHPLARRPAHGLVGENYNLGAMESAVGFTMETPGGARLRYPPGTKMIEGAQIDRQGLYRLRLDSGEETQWVATLGASWDEFDLAVDKDQLWQSPEPKQRAHNNYLASDYSYSHRSWLLAFVILLIEAGLFLVYGRMAPRAERRT